MDPNESNEIGLANSRGAIKKMVKDGLVMKRNVAIHSRSRARRHLESKRKGRHCGMGKRKGTRESRMPQKVLWMRRQRVLRRLLKKYRASRKIDKHQYHKFYLASKGNQFKNKTVLIEAIHKNKREKLQQDKLVEEQNARRMKNKEKREKKAARKQQQLEAM